MLKRILFAIHLLIGITAILGGLGLIGTNGLGVPVSFLGGSIFASYFFPGVLLIMVGVVNLVAFWLLIRNMVASYEASTCAGLGIIIFEFSEVYIIKQSHWLQVFYFILGILVVVLTQLLNRKKL